MQNYRSPDSERKWPTPHPYTAFAEQWVLRMGSQNARQVACSHPSSDLLELTELCPVHCGPIAMSRLFGGYDSFMPYGLKRFQKSWSPPFHYFNCFHRLPSLDALKSKNTVEAELEQTRARHQARIYSYVLAPEHVHLLINEPPAILLGQLLKAVKQTMSRKLRGGHEKFRQEHYYDSNLRGEPARS
jgi:Transposase and inactivated derivatives